LKPESPTKFDKMDNKNLSTAKINATFGIITLLAGIILLVMGETFIGISGSIVGVVLTLKGFKTIKEIKNG